MGYSDTDKQLKQLYIQCGALLEASAILLAKVSYGHSSPSLIPIWQHCVEFATETGLILTSSPYEAIGG